MVVRLSYKINSRQFRKRLDVCHLIVFVVCFIAAASITTINIIEGIPKRYTSLQYSSQCGKTCKVLLSSDWFPIQVALPLAEFREIDWKRFNLRQTSHYNYIVCPELQESAYGSGYSNFTADLPTHVVDYQSTTFRLPKNKFREDGLSFFVQNKNVTDNVILFGLGQNVEMYYQKPLDQTFLNVTEDQGKIIEIASQRQILKVGLNLYSVYNCTAYENTQQLADPRYNWLVAILDYNEKQTFTMDPFNFNFVGTENIYSTQFVVQMVVLAICCVCLVENAVYGVFKLHETWLKKQQYSVLQNYVNTVLEEQAHKRRHT